MLISTAAAVIPALLLSIIALAVMLIRRTQGVQKAPGSTLSIVHAQGIAGGGDRAATGESRVLLTDIIPPWQIAIEVKRYGSRRGR